MAVIQTTAIVAGVTGKLAGTVARRHRGQIVLSNKVTPRGKYTQQQAVAKAKFLYSQRLWKNLSQDQRNLWIESAKLYGTTIIDGEVHTMNGFQWYVHCSTIRQRSTGGALSVPGLPPVLVYPKLSNVRAIVSSQQVRITYSLPYFESSWRLDFFGIEPVPASHSPQFKNLSIMSLRVTESTSQDVNTQYRTKFPAFKAGQRISIGVQLRFPNGYTTSMQTFSVIAS